MVSAFAILYSVSIEHCNLQEQDVFMAVVLFMALDTHTKCFYVVTLCLDVDRGVLRVPYGIHLLYFLSLPTAL